MCVCCGWGITASHQELEEASYTAKESDLPEGVWPVQNWGLPPVLQPGYRKRTIPGDLGGPGEGGRHQPEQTAVAVLGRGNTGGEGKGRASLGRPQADSPAV